MTYQSNGYATGALGVPDYQHADDETALAARFAALERAVFAEPPRRPGVGDWILDMDSAGNLVAVNLRTAMQYPVSLGTGTPVPLH